MWIRLFIFTTLLCSLLFVTATQSLAATTCQSIYGGGQTCQSQTNNLSIIKEVANPQTQQFTSNLKQTEYIFQRSENVVFRFTLTNNATSTQSSLQILDTLPVNLDYVSSDGSFNSQTRLVTINVPTIAGKQIKTFTITTKVNNQNLPNREGVACITNQVNLQTRSFFFFTNPQGQNTAVFCISTNQTTIAPTPQSEMDQPTACQSQE